MTYSCCDDNRRAAILGHPTLNAIDYLELVDGDALPLAPPQQTLLVYCLKEVPDSLTADNILIQGGESITEIKASWVVRADLTSAQLPKGANLSATEWKYYNKLPSASHILVVRTSAAGDFSPYTLSLVSSAADASLDPFYIANALTGFDPQLSQVSFSFKIDCGPLFDCAPPSPDCAPPAITPPPINYLAKDYGSFRSIILDRMRQLLPGWDATSEADLGVALAELVAYVGDQLSYKQDAVTTEAYLLTARSRISLRRHARLVDYIVQDGCNARAWVRLTVATPVYLDHSQTRFYTFAPNMPSKVFGNEEAALAAGVVVFEAMQDANLFPEHNSMQLYTWGDLNCCLPQGATEATLKGSFPNLQVGDVLILQELLGPQTGIAEDADIRRRYAVRLTAVATVDVQGNPLVDPLFEVVTGKAIFSETQKPQPVTEIEWSIDDALPAPLCVSSSYLDANGMIQTVTNVSVAYGNVVLADHGLSMPAVDLPTVPAATLFLPQTADRCTPSNPTLLPVRYRPALADSPITQAVTLPTASGPVTSAAVPLARNGFASLSDTNGYTSLMIAVNDPQTWPTYFGVLASEDISGTSFTLEVVFFPSGATDPVVVESFTGLTTPAAAASAINQSSQLITASVPGGATTPTSFAVEPTMLSATGATKLLDNSGSNHYLDVKPTAPAAWPPLFAVLAQGNLQDASLFNLLLLYDSPFGAVGNVTLPVLLRQFSNVSLATAQQTFSQAPLLLTVMTFEQQPNPSLSATALTSYNAADAVPVITLGGVLDGNETQWTAVYDLLANGPEDANFVVEIERDGTATLRFGDDTNGKMPAAGTAFTANYRIGNGAAGNVGAESLVFLEGDPRILACTNPLPAAGGLAPETPAQIQRRAPQAFLTQERAITMADYASVTERNSQVESASASLRWTGSWYTTFVTAESQGGKGLGTSLSSTLTQSINQYRLAGQGLKVVGPQYVPLQIALNVCVDPSYFQTDVYKALMQVLGSGTQPNGLPGYFSPNLFKLGETVYLSPIYAAARAVDGVTSVVATAFQPQALPQTNVYLQAGEIALGSSQVAQMDNDPSLPANGQLTLHMQGGK